jgi:hypothetical protein
VLSLRFSIREGLDVLALLAGVEIGEVNAVDLGRMIERSLVGSEGA